MYSAQDLWAPAPELVFTLTTVGLRVFGAEEVLIKGNEFL